MIRQIDAKVFQALKLHMDTFTGADVYYSPDVSQEVGVISPYVIVTDARLDTDTLLHSSDASDEYRGFLNIAVMAPLGWTHSQGLGLAARVADHFPKGATYTYVDCTVKIMRRPKVSGTPYQDHGMLRFPVLVNWRAWG